MKILFICDWDYTDLWSDVAARSIEDEIIRDADALVVGKLWHQKLLKRQHPFKNVWLLQEHVESPDSIPVNKRRLQEIEQEYGNPTIWRFLWADRNWVFESFESSSRLLIKAFDFFEFLLDESRPDLIVTNGFASMPHLVGFEVAEKKGIPVLAPLPTRIGSFYAPSYDAYQNWSSATQPALRSEGSTKKAAEFLSAYRERPEKPAYEAITASQYRLSVHHIYRFFRYAWRYYVSATYANDHTKPPPIRRAVRMALPWLRRKIISRKNPWAPLVRDDRYVYFPLHVQPESSTMTLAPFYLNQVAIIENLAKSVPAGVQVYVKEHPNMLGKRPISYYEQFRKIANVKLIPTHTDNFEVIKNAELIFTVTGTAGLEGLFLKKPVITLGSTSYNSCRLVRNIGEVAPTQWHEPISDMLQNYEHDEDAVIEYLSSIFEQATEMCFREPSSAPEAVLSDENIKILSCFIGDEVGKLHSTKSRTREMTSA